MLEKYNITKEELVNIAKQNNKSIDEVLNDYKYALNNEEIPVDAKKYSYLTKPSIYDANNNKTQD